MSVTELLDRKDRPAFVRFERVAVEDKAASLREGHYVARDVDYALITPPYSKDVFKQKVTSWFESLKTDVQNERIPQDWVDLYQRQYQAWQSGQELPLNGTPIKGWGVISPAQQETLIRMNVMTVEDLAKINDEGIKRIGMGAIDLKNKAAAWLAQLQDKGPLTLEVAALKAENDLLKSSVETLSLNLESFKAQLAALTRSQGPALAVVEREEITAEDILEEPVRRKPGRPSNAEKAARA